MRGSNTVDVTNVLHTFTESYSVFMKKSCIFVNVYFNIRTYLPIRLLN